RQLPAARLAGQPPALLGRADPDRLLPDRWRTAGARGRAAGPAAGGLGVPADRRVAAAAGRALPEGDLPGLRRPGPPRDRHHGYLRRLVLVLPALREPARRPARLGPGGAQVLAAGRPVHGRVRA